MNKRWLILPLIALAFSSFGQTDTAYLNLVYQEIRKVQRSRTIHYAPTMMNVVSKYCMDYIKKGITSADHTDTLKLTDRERKYLVRHVKASKNSPWPDHLFPESKRLTADSMRSVLNKLNRVLFDSVNKLGSNAFVGKTAFLKYYWGFWFSRPVYLRNRSILIFHFMWYHNSAGEHTMYIYRKEGNVYKQWMYGCGGAW